MILPLVDIGLLANAARLAATLAFPYVAGSPVSCDPLPRIYTPLTLLVVMMLPVLVPDARNVLTLESPYVVLPPACVITALYSMVMGYSFVVIDTFVVLLSMIILADVSSVMMIW